MAEPKYRIQRNKKTGEERELVSHDGGRSWKLDSTSGPIPTELEADADESTPVKDIKWKPAPQQEPTGPKGFGDLRTMESAGAGRQVDEMDVPAYDYTSGDTGPKPSFGDMRVAESQLPRVKVGKGEAISREVGGDLGAGVGDRLRGADRAAHNRETERLGGIPRQRGRTFAPEDQELWSAEDYVFDEMSRRAAGRAQHPTSTMLANAGASIAQGAALPAARAAQGAGLLARTGVGAMNVGADMALAAGTAAAGAPPGSELDAARDALMPAGLVSTALRAPRGAANVARSVRDMATSALPPDTAQAARLLTDLSPEGASARAAARAGQRDLDPQTRKLTGLVSDIETARDQMQHWARHGGTKDSAMREAIRKDLATGDEVIPRAPRSGIEEGTFVSTGKGDPFEYQVKADIAPPMGTVPPPRGARGKQAPAAEHMTRTPASPPPAPGVMSSGLRPDATVSQSAAFLERQQQEFAEQLAHADDLGLASRQALRTMESLAQSTREQLIDALAKSGDDGADAVGDAYMLMDRYKQRMQQLSKNLRSGADNVQTQQRFRDMSEDARQHLEDPQGWGQHLAGTQREVNKAWTDDFTQRDRYRDTVLTKDGAKRSADPYDVLREGDPKKIGSILENAGRATNDVLERSMREGMGSTRKLATTLADKYNAPPAQRAHVERLGQAVDEALAEFDAVRQNLVTAREARDVAAASGTVGKLVNATGAIEETIRNSPAASAVARGVGATARVGSRMAEPGRKVAAGAVGSNVGRIATAQGAEAALDDERYGSLLKQKNGKDREAAYSLLMAQDAEFRARQRARAANAAEETQ